MFKSINNIEFITNQAVLLLRQIVSIESFSGSEEVRSSFICDFLESKGFKPKRVENNIIVKLFEAGPNAPVLMLNSHIDTVEPASGYSFDPFNPPLSNELVMGLGSNDAGASVVSMIAAFLHFASAHDNRSSAIDMTSSAIDNSTNVVDKLPFNLMLLLSAQEENSGPQGISLALKSCGKIDAAIVGEPTGMKAAVAERGLLVLDGEAKGVAGHAARGEGVNAIYVALEDIDLLKKFRFEKRSSLMGEVKLTVTQINAGNQHNVVPDLCTFVVDIRPTDFYSNSEITALLKNVVKSKLTPRNLLNRCSATPKGHPFLDTVSLLGIESYISPTTSDWMRLQIPAIKIGPGDSARSHRANEFITVSEIHSGIEGYINFIKNLKL